MVCVMTVRQRRPGAYDDRREAREFEDWPADLVRAWILRNQQDPDETVGIGFYEVGDDVDPLRDNLDRLAQDEHRLARTAPFVESMKLSGVFRVVEEVSPSR
jgi:hypothetical protein